MNTVLIGALGMALLLVLIALRFHIGAAMAFIGVIGITMMSGFDVALSVAGSAPFANLNSSTLAVIPMFTLMGTSNQESADKITAFETPPAVVETSAPPAQRTETPKFSMELPCAGTIIADCSIEDLVYCSSMNDWRTHNGLDIAGKIGEQVKAAESGVVSQVYKDDLLGVVVVVDHGNELSSLYANLQNEDFITVGTEVQKGDIIGGIGECGALEANLEPHLHFEVLSNDEYKNPMDFLNK